MPVSTKTPVAFLQWGPLHEPDEGSEAVRQLRIQLKEEGRETRTPYITHMRVTEPSTETFLTAVQWLVESHPALQVLYLSAHGVNGGICFDTEGAAYISYQTLGETFDSALKQLDSRPVIVLGACYALSKESDVHKQMPRAVLELIGFTAQPTSTNVAALIAAVLKSDEELLEKVTQAAAKAANSGTDVAAAAEAAYDGHLSRLERFVQGRKGFSIRHMSQDDQGMWTGYTVEIQS